MTEPELIAYLQQMEAAATSSTELATHQADALDRFYGRDYGNETDDRSRAHTFDVRELINWAMPGLMRVFAQSDELISIDGSDEQQIPAEMAQTMAKGLNHLYWQDNKGWSNTYDFLFDGLVQRVGIIQVRWLPEAQEPPETFEGIDQHGLMQLVHRGYKPISHGEPQQQPDGSIRLDVQAAKTKAARLDVRAVPPEEMTWEAGARSFDEAGYQRRVERVYIGDLKQSYPELADKIEAASGASGVVISDAQQRWTARHNDQGGAAAQQIDGANRQQAKTTYLTHEFVRVDYDGDGIVELRDIRRVGQLVLHNEAVEASEYVLWSPVRIPHTVSGLSLADDAMQTQVINTSLTRRGLDSLASHLNQRIAYDGTKVATTTVEDLADNRIGGLVKTNGPPDQALFPLSTPDVSEKALAWKGHFKSQLEAQTGIGPSSNGLAPESLAPNQSGIATNLAQTASSGRLEMIARAAANGLQEVFRRMLKLSVAHQTAPRTIQQEGAPPLVINPAQWPSSASPSVHVAMATANRQTQIAHLGMIKATQEQIMLKLGPNNPLCGLAEYATTLMQLVEAMGFRQTGRFFKKLPADFQLPQQQPQEDPKVVEAKLRAQIDTEKMRAEQVRLDEAQRAELDRKSAALAYELDLKRQQLAAELDMKRQQLAVELAMRREQLNGEAGMRPNGGGNFRPSPVRAGGMPG